MADTSEKVILFLGLIDPLLEWLKINGESVIQTSEKSRQNSSPPMESAFLSVTGIAIFLEKCP